MALKNGYYVLNSECFLDLPKEQLVKLLGSDDLQADEKTILNRAVQWATRRLKEQVLEHTLLFTDFFEGGSRV